MKAIIVGNTSAIGASIERELLNNGWEVEGWSRSAGVDVSLGQMPVVLVCDLVVHLAEVGPAGLLAVWNHVYDGLCGFGGSFVYISSISVVQDSNAYSVSKRMQESMLPGFACSHIKIRVNCLRLGHVIGTRQWPYGSKIRDQFLGRFVTPDDVACAVLFLANSASVTGQILTVDAGSSLSR